MTRTVHCFAFAMLAVLLAELPVFAQTTVTIGENTGGSANTFSGTDDTQFSQPAPGTNYGSSETMEVTKYSAGNHIHTALRFSGLSNIAGPVTVSDASIFVWWNSGAGNAQTLTAKQLLRNWVEGQASWNNYATGSAWGTAGGLNDSTDRVATPVATVNVDGSSGTPGYLEFTGVGVVALVEGWINGSIANHGVHIERTDGADNEYFLQLASSETVTNGRRPYLEVTYTAATSDPEITSVTPDTFEDADSGVVIAGSNFEASQGGGAVTICPTDDIDDMGCVGQTETAWADDEITFTAAVGGLTEDVTAYLFVENDTGDSNADGFEVEFSSGAAPSIVPLIMQQSAANDDERDRSFVANAR